MVLTSVDDAAWHSPWRRRRVGEKLALSLGLILTALLAPTWPGTLLVSIAAIVAILGCARIEPRVLALVMSAPLAFILIGTLPIAVSIGWTGGQATDQILWQLGPLTMSVQSLRTALRIFAHSIAGTLSIMVLATTTPMVDLITWLRNVHVPDALLEIASLTYRLLFILLESGLAIRQAQLNRLADYPGGGTAGFKNRIRAAGQAMSAIMVRAWSRSARLDQGLANRGYESALVTLPIYRPRSWKLIGGTAACLAAIWTISILVTQ